MSEYLTYYQYEHCRQILRQIQSLRLQPTQPSYLRLTDDEKERAQKLGLPFQYHQYAKPLRRLPILGGFVQQYDDRQTAWVIQDEHAFPTRWESMEMQYTHLKHSLSTFLENPTE